jgi:GxxExxY protein
MGIRVVHPVKALTEKAFYRFDYQVMAMAFNLYNSMGNLWDEKDYKAKLFECRTAEGLDAKSEVPVTLTHKDFKQIYFIDLLIEGSVYELKTTVDIAASHESQTLNYLFLTNTQHGKIINFRADSLQWRFVSTSLTFDQRKSHTLKTEKFFTGHQTTNNFPDVLSELLNAWGAFLDLHLYKDAVLFLMGKPREDMNSRFHPLSPEHLLHFTGLTRKKAAYQKNLQKFINASTYQQIDWINFDMNKVELHTLRKK